jgi:hypothetical protein
MARKETEMPLFRLKEGTPTTDSGDRGAGRLTEVSGRETVLLILWPHYNCILDAWEKQHHGVVSAH